MEATNGVLSAPPQQLKNEHRSLRADMNSFYETTEEIECEAGSTAVQLFSELYQQVSIFTDKLKAHSKREEEGLFPMLAQHLGENDRTIPTMEFEHEKAEQHLQDFLTEAKNKGTAINETEAQWISVSAVQAYTTLIQHFANEEKVLFPLAESILTVEEIEELGRLIQTR